jgi:hypothetical protein
VMLYTPRRMLRSKTLIQGLHVGLVWKVNEHREGCKKFSGLAGFCQIFRYL